MYGECCGFGDCWYQAVERERAGVCENGTGGGCPLTMPRGVIDGAATGEPDETAVVAEPPRIKRWHWYDHEGD
jgi:hypothetical protein